MNKNYFRSLLLLFTLPAFTASAQSPAPYCGTGDSTQLELYKRADVKRNMEELEKFTQEYMKNNANKRSSTQRIVIPMVFHIIHNNGPENISKAQVLDAVNVINTDYAKLNADTSQTIPQFKGIAAKIGFEFRIARIDPYGNCTEGITRTQSTLTNSAGDNVKSLVYWDAKKYLNVWVVNSIASGAGGYAYLPGSVPPNIDGIVILNRQFGSTGTSSASCDLCAGSLSHEIGHFFNLKHTWGNSNTPGPQYPENCQEDDLVTDTPECAGATGCNLYTDVACGPLANEQNYMDYAGCYTMFTEGQRQRMQAAAESNIGFRSGLWAQSNLVATGTEDGHAVVECIPVASFTSNKSTICKGGAINFTDQSYNATPSSWSWSFPGGNPSTSTSQNPTVSYDTEGTYDATLTSITTGGSSVPYTKKSIVIVRSGIAYYGMPFSDGFETTYGTEKGWSIINTNGDNVSWLKTNVGYAGKSSMFLNNNSTTNTFSADGLVSPPLDLSTTTSPKLTFYTAYAAKTTATNSDRLRVYVSYNCGETWSTVSTINAASLSDGVNLTGSSYIPANSADWKMQSINLNLTASKSFNTMFKFEYQNTGSVGNNLYIDEVNITGITGIDDLIKSSINLQVYPNPTDKDATISFTLVQPDLVTVEVVDVVGKVIYEKSNQKFDSGVQHINLNSIADKGIYFVRLTVGQQKFTKKLVIN